MKDIFHNIIDLMRQKLGFKTKSIIALASIWLMIILGMMLRIYGADRFPIDNNDDGLFYAWAGNSFWDNPAEVASHTIFDKDNLNLQWRSQYMDFIPVERMGLKITEPWFDHPPLATALVALPAKLLGYVNFEQIPHMIVRLPALLAAVFTLFLSYILAKDLFGGKTAWWSLWFLATTPYFVFAHRQSYIENLITPLFLAVAICVRSGKYKWGILASMAVGWFKIVGFAIGLIMAWWLMVQKKPKRAWQFIAGVVVSALGYLLYGLSVEAQAFKFTLLNQGDRGAHWSSFLQILTQPEFYGEFKDGLYVLGLVLVLGLMSMARNEAAKFYSLLVSGWLVVVFLIAGENTNSPWFKYPLIPFMAMALGYFWKKLMDSPGLFRVLPFFLLGFTGLNLIEIDVPSVWVRFITIGFLAPFGLYLIWQTKLMKMMVTVMCYALIAAITLVNIAVVLKYPGINCRKQQCLIPMKVVENYEK